MTNRVAGKVAIVTGAASGMGAVFARLLIAEGAKVMLTDINDKQGVAIANELGVGACFMHHDVASEIQWKETVAATETAFGPVSVLVNNAGIVTYSPIETLEEAAYRQIVDINQVSVFLGMKSVLSSMKRAGGGSIINISSVAGLVGHPNSLGYTASKFAVRGMTKSAAIEFAPYNIRVNSVHPGVIRTPLTAPTPETEALLAAIVATAPVGRIGETDDVAPIVLMLASDESRFSTGAEFVVDGGMTCH